MDPRVLAVVRGGTQEPAIGTGLHQSRVVPLFGIVADRIDLYQIVESHVEAFLDGRGRGRGVGELQRWPGVSGGHWNKGAQNGARRN